jgi:hypothetical protein
MRMIIPPLASRREIDRNFSIFFRYHRPSAFRRAVSDLCRFYGVKCPRVEWFEYIDWGKTAGKTYEDGRIHLVHPENWKRGRVYNYLLWTDAERKADVFMRRMVNGLRRSGRRAAVSPMRSRIGVPRRRRASTAATVRPRRRIARAS